MIEVIGDLWAAPTAWKIITTNGTYRRDGRAVMGRGCAMEAKERYPSLPARLGLRLQDEGNHVYVFEDIGVITFPVKEKWFYQAEVTLIAQSVREFEKILDPKSSYTIVRPGCGNGGLKWEQVRPYLNRLPNNVFVINKE